jgi:sugar O-acyltransferase (sialic acid O-acetyltransferase NeuD family)
VVVATAQAAGFTVAGLLDDDPSKLEKRILGVPVSGSTQLLEDMNVNQFVFCLGIGCNRTRKQIAEKYPYLPWTIVVHPEVVVHASVLLGAGTVVFAGAVVQPETRIGTHAIINTCASVDHDCVVGDFAHIAPGARLTGGVVVGEGVLVGAGATITPYRHIGDWATVGAGAVVIEDVPSGTVVVGVPAKPIKGL